MSSKRSCISKYKSVTPDIQIWESKKMKTYISNFPSFTNRKLKFYCFPYVSHSLSYTWLFCNSWYGLDSPWFWEAHPVFNCLHQIPNHWKNNQVHEIECSTYGKQENINFLFVKRGEIAYIYIHVFIFFTYLNVWCYWVVFGDAASLEGHLSFNSPLIHKQHKGHTL